MTPNQRKTLLIWDLAVCFFWSASYQSQDGTEEEMSERRMQLWERGLETPMAVAHGD